MTTLLIIATVIFVISSVVNIAIFIKLSNIYKINKIINESILDELKISNEVVEKAFNAWNRIVDTEDKMVKLTNEISDNYNELLNSYNSLIDCYNIIKEDYINRNELQIEEIKVEE